MKSIPLILIIFFVSACWADESEFDPRETVRLTVHLIEQHHVTHKTLDDELSRKWLQSFLDHLDPQRMYFQQSDLQEFQKLNDRLDDLAKNGDFEFAELVRTRYRMRVKEAVVHGKEALSAEHDFSLRETCPIQRDSYAASREELRERWRLSLKSELLIEKLHGRELTDVKAQLAGRFERLLRQAEEMTDERLCEVYLNSLAAMYDPHSSYFGPTLVATFNQSITVKKYRLGIRVEQRSGKFIVTDVHPSLQPSKEHEQFMGWCLLAIGRVDGPTIDLAEMDQMDYRDIIRNTDGPLESDTEVILELMHPITRKRVTMSWIRY